MGMTTQMPGPKHANKAHLPPRAISKKTTGLASAIVIVELDVCRCDEEGSLHLDRSLMFP